MMERLVARVMRRSLREAFRRVVLTDPDPARTAGPIFGLDPARPVVLYANHHYFHDGFLLWLLLGHLGRRSVTWMEAWDRAPLFAPVGARPFPPDDPSRRAATVRATARDFAARPASGLIWFPEGVLHRPTGGILAFDPATPGRLHELLGRPQWMAAALHVAWGPEPRPSALIGTGPVQDAPDGAEYERLAALVSALETADLAAGRVLLEGRRGPDETLPLHLTRRFFARYL